jgi:hypothetical protein
MNNEDNDFNVINSEGTNFGCSRIVSERNLNNKKKQKEFVDQELRAVRERERERERMTK